MAKIFMFSVYEGLGEMKYLNRRKKRLLNEFVRRFSAMFLILHNIAYFLVIYKANNLFPDGLLSDNII